MKLKRNRWAGSLRNSDQGQTVVVAGWVQRVRDHGRLLFVDLRDRSGLLQIVFDSETGPELYEAAKQLRAEYVVAVEGTVKGRAESARNPRMATGDIELRPQAMELLNRAKTPPFYIEENVSADELLRLRHRYLDLRRPDLQRNLVLRHRFLKAVRDFFHREGFLEIETPVLTKSTPEGARDFLVPSRSQPGQFYALPQSPQLFKQLLMVAGMERYFQVVKCFRDEDLRADRQPEFTQIDVEMSFVTEDDVLATMERMVAEALASVGVTVTTPFPRISYAEAMARYGSDKPDLRFGMEIRDLTSIVAASGLGLFRQTAEAGGVVRALPVLGGEHFSRRELDELTETAKQRGAKGLVWIAFGEEVRSPVAKFLTEAELTRIRSALGLEHGLALIVADQAEIAAGVLGHLRLVLAEKLQLRREGNALAWVVEFPLFEWDAEEQRWQAKHHPFTAPRDEDLPFLETDPGRVRAQAYDLAWNGSEAGGGSIRIHTRSVQERVFEVLGFTREQAVEKFGFLLEAFEYGTPPHGGIAFGVDRMVAMLAGADSIRDVIAFPKTARGSDPMTGAPGPVDETQLVELHIAVRTEEDAG